MTASITGRVIGSDGRPVQGAAVYIAGGPAAIPDIAAETDEHGEFAFDGLQPGTWEIRASASGGRNGSAIAEVKSPVAVQVTIRVRDGLSQVGGRERESY